MVKRFVALLVWLAVLLPAARAQNGGPDDQYIIIYSLIQQADSSAGSDQPRQALAQYLGVQADLKRFAQLYPDWNPRIVNFRLNYIAEKIIEVSQKLPVATNAPTATVAGPAASDEAQTAVVADLQGQLGALHAQMQKMQAANSTLQSKLQEALGAQPAAIDSRELARAQEKIRALMKENDLLKVSLAQGKSGPEAGAAGGESDAVRQLQAALAAATLKLAEQTARANQLAQENQALQTRVQTLLASPGALEALREENAVLKKQVADLQAAAPASAEAQRLNSELDETRKQITILQSAAQAGFLEKAALENQVRQLQITAVKLSPVAASSQSASEERIRALTQERDDLLAKLGEANRELYGSRKQNAAARIGALTDEVSALRARLAVDEAQVIPYTPEELVLFKSAAPQLADRNPEKKSVRELPGGAAELVAEAQHYFSTGQYDKAEDNYQKILQHDQNNGLVLANLATIEMEQGKLDEAEKHIKEAVAQSPNDAYNLSVLGYLKFRQEKYDDALDALSRAAKLDPRNPEIENYLGVTLGHKGLRAQAETALRKAIQLDPNYGAAHNNLAVVYLSQHPPLAALARWHYQKALDLGQSRNPDLEQMLEAKAAPASTP
jgi:tetratricopeptide (TPR) repeat protein